MPAVRRRPGEVAGAGDTAAHVGMAGGGKPAHGLGVVVEVGDPRQDHGAPVALIKFEADGGSLLLGQVGPHGDGVPDPLVLVLGEDGDGRRVETGVRRQPLPDLRSAVRREPRCHFGREATGVQGPASRATELLEAGLVQGVVLVVAEPGGGTNLLVGVGEQPFPYERREMGPGWIAGRGPDGGNRVGGEGAEQYHGQSAQPGGLGPDQRGRAGGERLATGVGQRCARPPSPLDEHSPPRTARLRHDESGPLLRGQLMSCLDESAANVPVRVGDRGIEDDRREVLAPQEAGSDVEQTDQQVLRSRPVVAEGAPAVDRLHQVVGCHGHHPAWSAAGLVQGVVLVAAGRVCR